MRRHALDLEPRKVASATAALAFTGIGLVMAQNRQLKKQLAAEKQNGILDAKTGLLVYPAFEEKVVKRTGLAERKADVGRTHAMILLDIDDFKEWNTRLTHPVNDREALLPVSAIMKSVVRPDTDLVSRFGGEEFILYLSDTDTEGARIVCERVQGQINSLHPEENSPDVLGATMSYTTFQQGDYPEKLEGLTKPLAAALNLAKEVPGKNQVVAMTDAATMEAQLSLLSEIAQ